MSISDLVGPGLSETKLGKSVSNFQARPDRAIAYYMAYVFIFFKLVRRQQCIKLFFHII